MKELFKETESIAVWREDGIICLVFKKSRVDIADAMEAVDATTVLAEGRPYPYYFDISHIRSISKEAREYLGVPRSPELNIATAALASNIIAKLIGTFFMSFSNPGVKIKLFTEEKEALKWLKEMQAKAGL